VRSKKPTITITLRRTNGRFVKAAQRHSRYAAKKVVDRWTYEYDSASYYIEIT